VTERKRAGEPDTPRGVAGAPASPSGRAGAPPSEPAAPEPRADEQPGAKHEGDAVQQDIDELLLEARKERDEYLELAQRTKADFENYRRRASREASEAERRAKAGLARELVPVLDNLERALGAAQIDPDEAGDGDGAGLAHGVLLVYRDLRATIERAGVETYDPVGEKFDPEWHEALSMRPAEGAEPGTVLETVEKGYRLDGQVLRPARVVVSE
jgi:molecular chaperone GrpE